MGIKDIIDKEFSPPNRESTMVRTETARSRIAYRVFGSPVSFSQDGGGCEYPIAAS